MWVADGDGEDRRNLGPLPPPTAPASRPTVRRSPSGAGRRRPPAAAAGCRQRRRHQPAREPVGSPVYVSSVPWSPDGSQVAVTMQRGLTNTETFRRSLDDVNIVGAGAVVRTFNACGTMALGKDPMPGLVGRWKRTADGREPLDSDGDQLPGVRWRVFRMNADGTGQSSFHGAAGRPLLRMLRTSRSAGTGPGCSSPATTASRGPRRCGPSSGPPRVTSRGSTPRTAR